MYEAWAHDPSSVHASWDAYFRYTVDENLRIWLLYLSLGEERTRLLHLWAIQQTQMRLLWPPWVVPCLAWEVELQVQRSLMHILQFRGPSGPTRWKNCPVGKNIIAVAFFRCEATWLPRLTPWGWTTWKEKRRKRWSFGLSLLTKRYIHDVIHLS